MDLTGRTIEQIRFEALIGRGGMGSVYRAFDLRLKRQVAVKVLRDHSRRAAEARGRFMREARLLSRLDHPGICRVHDLIVHPEANLLVLELIEGQTLRQVDATAWPLAKQLELARDIADALAAAHRQLVLHRDLKPDNVMLTEAGQVKILDFGIARPLVDQIALSSGDRENEAPPRVEDLDPDHEDDEITLFAGAFDALKAQPGATPEARQPAAGETFYTLRGATVGTVAYMSPEQALGHDLTVASDMYAFGILLQELFTGKRAYPKISLLELFQRVARAEAEPLEGIDGNLADVIRELEQQNPELRPSAEETRERLQVLIDRPTLKRRQRRRFLTAALALLLVATIIGAVVYSRFESRRQSALAERFAQQASAVEWLLRAEHLSPAHDVTPARLNVQAQLDVLARQLPQGNRLGRAAGSYALGRAHLALDELQAARSHLQEAWEGGYRLPEVDSYLGLALVRLYARESEKARRIPSEDKRESRLARLDKELRRPGVEHLKSGRFAKTTVEGRSPVLSIEPEHYPRALIAFEEGRLEEGLEHATAAAAKWPWFYEAELLAAQIELRGALEHSDRGDVAPAMTAFTRARDRAARAATTARSDPRVAADQCMIEKSILDLEISHTFLSEAAAIEVFEIGIGACRKAHALDPQSARALRLLASMLQRGAEAGVSEEDYGDDPRPLLEEAAGFAKRAVELDENDAAGWKSLGDIFSMRADWEFFRGVDPTTAITEMQAAYENAFRLNPNESRYANAFGNALCFRGEIDAKAGRDPRPMVRAAAAAYQQSEALNPAGHAGQALINQALCSMPAVRFEFAVGIDPKDTIEAIDDALTAAKPHAEGTFRLWRQIGEASEARALRDALWNAEASPAIEAAEHAFARATELAPGDIHTRSAMIRLPLISTWLDPENAADALDRAELLVEDVLAIAETWHAGLIGRGELARHRLALASTTGRAARAEIRAGREALRAVLEDEPSNAAVHLELGRLALAEAAFDARAGGNPQAAWQRAEEALQETARRWPERPDLYLAFAALEHHRSEITGDSAAASKAKEYFSTAKELRQKLTAEPAPDYWLAGAALEAQLRWPW